jgi:hypothetical protein
VGLKTRVSRKLFDTVFGRGAWIDRYGDFRARERHGLLFRPNYAYGMLRAADMGKYFGHKSVTVIEFGVAGGDGLLNMIELASLIEQHTGMKLKVVGFDTGAGLPVVNGYKDHPEIWNIGDFATPDRNKLLQKINGRAQLIWGDIANTANPFIEELDQRSPIGFISIDVDIYSATKSALRCLLDDPSKYLPAVSMYFDDVGFFFANRWCGELAAIEEFNAENNARKIDHDRSLPGLRSSRSEGWYSNMFACHILDHPARQTPRERNSLDIDEHLRFIESYSLR